MNDRGSRCQAGWISYGLLLAAASTQAAEPAAAVQAAVAACASFQERFEGTECSAVAARAGTYHVTIKAGSPDAMRVVFMRSLDVADGLCGAGQRVELTQQLETSAGTRRVRWTMVPPDCAVRREN